jgi:trans-aconitate 2-methyltransferase
VTDVWNPTQYDKFRREREQPFFDLLALVKPVPDMRVVDLGCGTGQLTRLVHARLQARETVGIDRSARMLERVMAGERPAGLRFEIGAIETFAPRDAYDLILSNAAFHWVEDHESLITRLTAALKPGGQLVFQIPAMHNATSHTIADDLAAAEPYRAAFGGWRRPQPVLTPDAYARLLFRAGCVDQTVRLVVYPHVLATPEHVVEWMKGTLLTEYERRLTPELFVRFVGDYRARLLSTLEDARPFFFPFNRILCWAQKSA